MNNIQFYKKNSLLFILFFAIFIHHSCDEDFFNSVVSIDLDEHESRMVPFGFFEVSSPDNMLGLSHSVGTLDNSYLHNGGSQPDNIPLVNDATVELYRNDELVFVLDEVGSSSNYHLDNLLPLNDDAIFTIKIQHPNFVDIQASQVIPSDAFILSVEKTGRTQGGEFGEEFVEFNMRIEDDLNVENYYAIEWFLVDTYHGFRDRIYLESDDISVERGLRRELLFSDFNGITDIKILADMYQVEEVENNPDQHILCVLKSISEDRYLYGRSFRRYREAEGNPFAEPVTIHSNFENGYGLFSIEKEDDFIYN